jgi:hypothetical protein
MRLNLDRLESQGDRPSIRVSYSSSDQCHYIHRDFGGPFGTLVRICLVRISDIHLRECQHYLDLLIALGHNIGGYVRVRYTVESRHLINCVANSIPNPLGERPVWPSPADPCLPDTREEPAPLVGALDVQRNTVVLTRGNEGNIPGHAM